MSYLQSGVGISVEQTVADVLAADVTDSWHFAWIFANAYPLPRDHDAMRHIVGHVRRRTLEKIGTALIEGYDGGETAPRPRNAAEHRVGAMYVGSVLLAGLNRFDGIDWWHVTRLLEPMVADHDRTPPLQRKENHASAVRLRAR